MKSLAISAVVLGSLVPAARADLIVGQVVNGSGQPVAAVNIDAIDVASGNDVVLLNDGTDAGGFFSTTIPAGLFDLTFKPPSGSSLLEKTLKNVAVIGTKNLGVIVLTNGATLSGKIVNPAGIGVPNVDFDVTDAAGNDVDLSGDFTDGAGNFSFLVPQGPILLEIDPTNVVGQTLVAQQMELAISGSLSLGTIALENGFLLSGLVHNPGGTALVGADIDAVKSATGVEVFTPHDKTGASGLFSIVVPAGTFVLEVCPPMGALLVPKTVPGVVVTGQTSAGTITLASGFALSGTVKNGGGAAVAGADIDVLNAATGAQLLLCFDDTSATGAFSVVVPAGTYHVHACPPTASGLAPAQVSNVTVAGSTGIGTITVPPGVLLSGTVRDSFAAPVAKAVVSATHQASGLPALICDDTADPAGKYAVVLPSGTYTVKFSPPSFLVPLGSDLHPNVVLSSATTLDGVLPACPFSSSYGAGLAGSGGFVPVLSSSGGAPIVGNPGWAFVMTNGLGGTFAILAVGFGPGALPLFGGTILIDAFGPYATFVQLLSGSAGVPGAGAKTFPLPVPITTSIAGIAIYAQEFVLDSGAVLGIAMSQGLTTTFCQ